MRHERLFLCGGALPPGGIKFASRVKRMPLVLWGQKANITLRISDITRTMAKNLPVLYADLLEIATYVYCADQATSRGGSGARDLGAKWRRNMHFVIPVRRSGFWSKQEVKDVLEETLGFLSDDDYDFHFTTLHNPPPPETYLEFHKGDIHFRPDEILLFSGGLDSLAGAIKEAFVDQNRAALVSHRSAPKIAPKQKMLCAEIQRLCPSDSKPMHVPVWIHKHGWTASDDSQRSRSFLYASLAAVVAAMFGRNRIRFYENGITSLNVPIAEQVLGARATRTTHPKSIAGFRELFSLISDGSFDVETPFLWKTKTDVVELIENVGQTDLIKHAVSCSNVFGMTKLHTHCGCCSQCIDRRLSIFAADCVDYDPDEMYKTDVFTGQRSAKGQDITLAESYVRTIRQIPDMTVMQFFHTYGELTRAITDIPGHSDLVAENIFQLYKRNGEQIRYAIKNAIIHYAEDIGRDVLPDRCLLRQLFGTKVPPAEPIETQTNIHEESEEQYIFKNGGGVWQIVFEGNDPVFLADELKGAKYLVFLINNQGKQFSYQDIVSAAREDKFVVWKMSTEEALDEELSIIKGGKRDLGKMLECTDRKTIEKAVAQLEVEKEQASDPAEKLEIQDKIEQIEQYLQKATDIHGRPRKLADPAESQRISVRQNIDLALNKIKVNNENLWQHLHDEMRKTGYKCYRPDPPIPWKIHFKNQL